MPENGVKVKLRFRKTVTADVVGSAATALLERLEGDSSGQQSLTQAETKVPDNALLVTENFNSKLVAATELANFTSCKFGRIKERLTVPIPQGLEVLVGPASSAGDAGSKVVDLLMCHLEEVFDELSIGSAGSVDSRGAGKSIAGAEKQITVQSLVTLSVGYAADGAVSTSARRPTHVLIEWTGSPVSDTVADCVAGLVMQAFSAFNSLRRTMSSGANGANSSRRKRRKVDAPVEESAGAEQPVVKQEDGAAPHSGIVASMLKGEVDPSKHIKQQYEKNPTKLRALLALVESGPHARHFSECKLNAEGDKLIFRGVPGAVYVVSEAGEVSVSDSAVSESGMEVEGTAQAAEAFVFVQFADNSGNSDTGSSGSAGEHHAVVQSADEGFRKFVMQALSSA
jgi:hypothetical protein